MALANASRTHLIRSIVDSDARVSISDPGNFVYSGGANINKAMCSKERLALVIPIHNEPHSWPGEDVIPLRFNELVEVRGLPPGVRASPRIMSDDKLRVQLHIKDRRNSGTGVITQGGLKQKDRITATLQTVEQDDEAYQIDLFKGLRFIKSGDYEMEISVEEPPRRGSSHHLLSLKRMIKVLSEEEHISLFRETGGRVETGHRTLMIGNAQVKKRTRKYNMQTQSITIKPIDRLAKMQES